MAGRCWSLGCSHGPPAHRWRAAESGWPRWLTLPCRAAHPAVHEGRDETPPSCSGPLCIWGNREAGLSHQITEFWHLCKAFSQLVPHSERRSRTRLRKTPAPGNRASGSWSRRQAHGLRQPVSSSAGAACSSGSVALRCSNGVESKRGFIHHLPQRRRPQEFLKHTKEGRFRDTCTQSP